MTEREKRIEEMANDIPEKTNVMFSQKTYILLSEYLIKNISTALVKKGYRKADKDGVFHIDISDELTKDFFQNEIEKARKEAIKEFVETVKRCLPNEPYLHTHIREIASIKFGVEVEE